MIDFDAMWGSDKLALCEEWAQAEYAWLYGLADAHGSFEVTNLRVVWGRVAAIRKNLSVERLEQILEEFRDKGLLFVWGHDGKTFGHWTGSDKPGRLPSESTRGRYSRLAPPVPEKQLKTYLESIVSASRLSHGRFEVGLKLVREKHCANTNGSHDSFPPPETFDTTSEPLNPSNTPDALAEAVFPKTSEEDAAVRRLWVYYIQKFEKNEKLYSFTQLRKSKGQARLHECLAKTGDNLEKAEGLMRLAIDALAASAFHRGENDRKKRYDSWEKNLFSSQEQFERWLEQSD